MNDINFLKANGVDIESSVNTFGVELYNESLGIFLDEIMDKIHKLQECLQTGNIKDYTTYVHAIKGESLYLGFKDLASLALTHQQKGEINDLVYITNNFVPLITEIGRVIKVGKIYLGRE